MSGLENALEAVSAALLGQIGTLIVIVPLMVAPIVALVRRPVPVAVLTVGVGAICLGLAVALIGASADEPVRYALGGWQPPIGIGFHVDALSSLVALMVAGAFLLAAIYACVTGIDADRASYIGAAGLLCLAGLLGVVLTGDLFNMFVFLEISSLSAYALIAAGGWRDRRALKAAFDYLIMGSIGASFFVIGVGFLYGVTGTLNMADMSDRLAALGDNRAATAGFAFITAGLGLKAAMFPVHQWLPSGYAYAPPTVTVFLSASATKVALYALMRVVFDIVGFDSPIAESALTWIIAPMAAAAAILCSAKAVFESDVRRIFAWSSVAQAGYMMLAVAIGSAAALSAAMFHMVSHALIKSAVFMAVGAVGQQRGGKVTVRDLTGAMRSAPLTMSLFAISALSLAGMPPTLGFVSKWLLLEAFVSAGWVWAVVVLAISGLLSFAYVGKIFLPAFMELPDPEAPRIRESAPAVLTLLTAMALIHIGFGLNGSPIRNLTEAAARVIAPPASVAVPVSESVR